MVEETLPNAPIRKVANAIPTQVKTYKREVALALLFVLAVVGGGALLNEQAMLIFDKLRWPVFTFAAGAFGLDALAKQWSNR